jgi:hypothetical protein
MAQEVDLTTATKELPWMCLKNESYQTNNSLT